MYLIIYGLSLVMPMSAMCIIIMITALQRNYYSLFIILLILKNSVQGLKFGLNDFLFDWFYIQCYITYCCVEYVCYF